MQEVIPPFFVLQSWVLNIKASVPHMKVKQCVPIPDQTLGQKMMQITGSLALLKRKSIFPCIYLFSHHMKKEQNFCDYDFALAPSKTIIDNNITAVVLIVLGGFFSSWLCHKNVYSLRSRNSWKIITLTVIMYMETNWSVINTSYLFDPSQKLRGCAHSKTTYFLLNSYLHAWQRLYISPRVIFKNSDILERNLVHVFKFQFLG